MGMILQTKNGPEDLSTDTVAALKMVWPTRDVDAELAKMHLWLLRNPAARPVKVFRFVNNWLKKAPAVRRPEPKVSAWWTTVERTVNQGAALGMQARPGESMEQYRERISARMGQAH